MQKLSKAETIRRNVTIPRRLVEEISFLAPTDATRDWNRLVIAALEEYVERHGRLRIEPAMAAMAADPWIQRETKKINKAFRKTDTDGLM
jgi:hypothetical protein